MITKLEELTAAQFIDLVSGDTSVLHTRREIVSDVKMSDTIHSIVFEYRSIIDESGAKGYISRMGKLIKAKILVLIFKMCRNLVELKEYDRVKEVMTECGIKAYSMSDSRLVAEVNSRLERAKREVSIHEIKDEDTPDIADIRKSFDEQTAAMMAHFKFQIDTSTMKATLYAHLVARFNREIKAQMEALKKK